MRLPAIFLLLLVSAAASAQIDSTFLRGNWLKTDGSNTLHFAVFSNAVCYNNKTWKIKSFQQSAIQLEHLGEVITVSIKKKDDNSIELTSGKDRVVLKKHRTFVPKYKPSKSQLQAPYVHPAEVSISGVINNKNLEKGGLDERFVTISYRNELTNDEEIAFGDIDEDGRFELKLMLYRPQICDIRFRNNKLHSFFAQPGASMVLAINDEIEISPENPDYDKLTQRFSVMGDDAIFNNHYQHFLYYSATMQFPSLEFSPKIHKGKTLPEKKAMIYAWHKEKEDELLNNVSYVYPERSTEARFLKYIREEIRYTIGASLFSSFRDDYGEPGYSTLKIDSTDLRKIREMYLSSISADAMNHASFYKLATAFARHTIDVKRKGSYTYSVPGNRISDRVLNEFRPLLPQTFVESFQMIMQDMGTLNVRLNESQMMERYFNGSKEQMDYFEVMFKYIQNETSKEVMDTIHYEDNLELIQDPYLRYVANLKVLDDTQSEYKTPSVYRLALYKRYSEGGVGPWRIVDSLRRENALFTGLAGVAAKSNLTTIEDLRDEVQWQNMLERHKGKAIVLWLFGGRYEKPEAYASMHELKKMRKLFEGKNVVFIKCILERRSDAMEHLMSYIQAFARNGEFSDLYRVSGTVSMNGVRSEAIRYMSLIYGENGMVHHPEYFQNLSDASKRGKLSFVNELNLVLSGHGRYNEPYATYFLQHPMGSYSSSSNVNRWSLAHHSGNYYTYQFFEPKEVSYDRGRDSIFHQFIFHRDSVIEQTLYLKKQKRGTYLKEHKLNDVWGYTYDPKQYMLTLTEKSAVRKRYRVVMITTQVMLLELLD